MGLGLARIVPGEKSEANEEESWRSETARIQREVIFVFTIF